MEPYAVREGGPAPPYACGTSGCLRPAPIGSAHAKGSRSSWDSCGL